MEADDGPAPSWDSLPADALAEVTKRLTLSERRKLGIAKGSTARATRTLSQDDYRRTFVSSIGAPDAASVGPAERVRMWNWADFFSVLYQSYDVRATISFRTLSAMIYFILSTW